MAFNPLSVLVLKCRGRSIAVPRSKCLFYDEILDVARRNFLSLKIVPVQDIILLATIPNYPDQGQTEIPRETWRMISEIVPSVTIVIESEMRTSNERNCSLSAPAESNESLATSATLASTGSSPALPPASLVPAARPNALRSARQVVQSSGVGHQTGASALDDILTTRVRKPIIYLYPPSSLSDVTVEMLLTSSWHFSAVYPPPQTPMPSGEHETAHSLTWAIAAEPDGTLVDKTTGTEVSYLYWEAITNTHLITPNVSRVSTPVEDIETFDPSRPSVSPGESVFLPISKVPGYLDAALKALALHTDARTNFITYWLPDLLKHKYVALRFLAQASYEKAARMCVSPTPDVVTRVFMLFRGVAPDDLGLWAQAAARATAEDGATFWADVVGVNAARASDPTLFRILEWGGMEVY